MRVRFTLFCGARRSLKVKVCRAAGLGNILCEAPHLLFPHSHYTSELTPVGGCMSCTQKTCSYTTSAVDVGQTAAGAGEAVPVAQPALQGDDILPEKAATGPVSQETGMHLTALLLHPHCAHPLSLPCACLCVCPASLDPTPAGVVTWICGNCHAQAMQVHSVIPNLEG